jgi:hypothetical protein
MEAAARSLLISFCEKLSISCPMISVFRRLLNPDVAAGEGSADEITVTETDRNGIRSGRKWPARTGVEPVYQPGEVCCLPTCTFRRYNFVTTFSKHRGCAQDRATEFRAEASKTFQLSTFLE